MNGSPSVQSEPRIDRGGGSRQTRKEKVDQMARPFCFRVTSTARSMDSELNPT